MIKKKVHSLNTNERKVSFQINERVIKVNILNKLLTKFYREKRSFLILRLYMREEASSFFKFEKDSFLNRTYIEMKLYIIFT